MDTQVLDNTIDDPAQKPTLITGGMDHEQITEIVCGISESRKMPTAWWVALTISSALLVLFFAMIAYLISTGVYPVLLNRHSDFRGADRSQSVIFPSLSIDSIHPIVSIVV